MAGKVISLGAVTDNAQFVTPADILREAADDLDAGKLKADKCLVLLLDTEDGGFGLSFRNAKMKCSEMVATCEAMKARFLAMMGFIDGPDSR